MTDRLFLSGRRCGKTAAAARAAGMSIDDYRAMMQRQHEDRVRLNEELQRSAWPRLDGGSAWPRLDGGSDWIRQQFERAEVLKRCVAVDVADGVAAWCAMIHSADGISTVLDAGKMTAPASWPEGGFIFSDG